MRCSACRYCLQGTTTGRGKRVYRCTVRHAGGRCPSPARIGADTVEQAVVSAFWKLTAELEAEGRPDVSGKLIQLERAFERAETSLAQWTSPQVQDAIGDLAEYAAGLRERRQARDHAAAELGRVRAAAERPETPPTETLRSAWERMNIRERRELLGLRFDCLALGRGGRLVVYPAGRGPGGLPRRGFTRAPELTPFPDPPRGTRVLAL